MIKIETYYLIDYENVGSDGLSGCDKLNKSDHIIIFFTKNAKKIDMRQIANHGDAELDMIEVPAGKQSADIHIGSYLGYLAGTNKGKDCSIVIISKDTDFDNVIKFWKTKTGVKSSRTQQIKISTPKASIAKQATVSKKSSTKAADRNRMTLNNEIMQVLSKAGFESDIVGYVASSVVKNVGVEDGKQQIYRTVISKYGQSKGLNIYNHIKKHI